MGLRIAGGASTIRASTAEGSHVWRIPLLIGLLLAAAFLVRGLTASDEALPVHAAVAAWTEEHPAEPVPLIVQHDGTPDDLLAFVQRAGGTVEREFHIIPALDVAIPADSLNALARQSDVVWLSLDAPLLSAGKGNEPLPNPRKLANTFPAAVGATAVWEDYAGDGVAVAVVDTGISDDDNPDFAFGQLERVVVEVAANSTTTSTEDGYGHGTHVAGIVGGDGSFFSDNRYAGVAPRVKLVDVKIGDAQGNATIGDLLGGLEWVDDNRNIHNIRVVNLSLTSSVAQSYLVDPLDAAVELLWFHGVAVVVSAGNLGTAADAVFYPPANDPFVIVVGAVDDRGTAKQSDDAITSWSSRGTTQDGFLKPDVLAPGRNLISNIDPLSVLATAHPDHVVDGSYFRMSGTSMSAGVVSGVVALIREAHPDWLPGQVKYVLSETAGAVNGQKGLEVRADQAIAFSGGLQSTDDGLTPSYILLSAAGVADADLAGMVWRDANFDGIRWGGLELNGIRWGAVDWNGIRWGSVSFDGIRWGGLSFEGIRWGGIRWGGLVEN
ncbi:MAG: S8 family peptidase [Chloroflexi bacterium]|nr:S8 family peptidase [Chloroflexota bacterium]